MTWPLCAVPSLPPPYMPLNDPAPVCVLCRFAEEMKFQTQMVSEMGAEKEKAEAENVRCRREVELSREKEKEYLQQVRRAVKTRSDGSPSEDY